MSTPLEEPDPTSETRGYRSWYFDERRAILNQSIQARVETGGFILLAIGGFVFLLMLFVTNVVTKTPDDLSAGEFMISLAAGGVIGFIGLILLGCGGNGRTQQHKLMEETGVVHSFSDPADQLLAERLMHRYHLAGCPGKHPRDDMDKLLTARHEGLRAIELGNAAMYNQALQDINEVANKGMANRLWL